MIGDAVDLADLGEAPLDAAEAGEAALDRPSSAMPISSATPIAASAFWTLWRPGIGSSMPLDRAHRRRRGRGSTTSKRLPPGIGVDILAAHIGLGGEAVGDDAPVAHARDDRLHLGMIDAQQGRAVERHVLDELDERVLDRVEAAIMIEMLGIDIGDDRDRAVEPQEAAVALVGLDHHPVGLRRAARWSRSC